MSQRLVTHAQDAKVGDVLIEQRRFSIDSVKTWTAEHNGIRFTTLGPYTYRADAVIIIERPDSNTKD